MGNKLHCPATTTTNTTSRWVGLGIRSQYLSFYTYSANLTHCSTFSPQRSSETSIRSYPFAPPTGIGPGCSRTTSRIFIIYMRTGCADLQPCWLVFPLFGALNSILPNFQSLTLSALVIPHPNPGSPNIQTPNTTRVVLTVTMLARNRSGI